MRKQSNIFTKETMFYTFSFAAFIRQFRTLFDTANIESFDPQQEILFVNMSNDSPIAASTVSIAIETTTTCNTCLLSDTSENKTFCIKVPVQNSVRLALSKYLVQQLRVRIFVFAAER